jgi:hypothetical protein
VEAYGAELSGTYKPGFLHGLAYFNLNATYNHARALDNVMNGTAILYATQGKVLPDSATWLVNGGVTVEPASWLVANFSGKYTSGRWSTLDNTPGSNVPAFTVWNAYVDLGDGWHLGPLKTVKARFNIDNLLDKNTLAFISTTATGDGYSVRCRRGPISSASRLNIDEVSGRLTLVGASPRPRWPLISAPASGAKRRFQIVAVSEMVQTAQKATEKSSCAGRTWPSISIAPCSAIAPAQMPNDSISCWKVA